MALLSANVRNERLGGSVLRGANGRPEHNITLLQRAQQFGFKKNNLRSGVDDVLAYLERCRISETAGATQPLALEVYVELLETVGGVLALGVTPHRTLLPEPYVATLLHSPLIGQADATTQMQLAAVSDLWSGVSHKAARDAATWTSLGGRKVVSAANAASRAEEKHAVEFDDEADDDLNDLADDFVMAAALGRRQQQPRGKSTAGSSSRRPGSGGGNKQQNAGARNRRGRGNFTY